MTTATPIPQGREVKKERNGLTGGNAAAIGLGALGIVDREAKRRHMNSSMFRASTRELHRSVIGAAKHFGTDRNTIAQNIKAARSNIAKSKTRNKYGLAAAGLLAAGGVANTFMSKNQS